LRQVDLVEPIQELFHTAHLLEALHQPLPLPEGEIIPSPLPLGEMRVQKLLQPFRIMYSKPPVLRDEVLQLPPDHRQAVQVPLQLCEVHPLQRVPEGVEPPGLNHSLHEVLQHSFRMRPPLSP